MAKPNRLKFIAASREQTVEEMVLEMLNKHGTVRGAAKDIGVSYQTLWDYVHVRFNKVCRWVEIEVEIIDGEVISTRPSSQHNPPPAPAVTSSAERED